MIETTKIIKISNNSSAIQIEWADGQKSIFHYLWLRDNCSKDIHPTARERLFNLVNVSENIKPESYEIKKNGKLEIKWNEGGHISIFEPNWLRNNCYSRP